MTWPALPVVFSTVLLAVAPAASSAQQRLVPIRADVAPVIDGALDDPVWKVAPSVTGFKTYMPDYELTMADQTQVWYAYDPENIFFAFRCLDSEPGRIKTSINSRDRIRPDDWIGINLDSFNDKQALYTFYVNALGIQMDARFAANREDFGFDAVWYSAGRIDDQGYTVEVRLPFKSLHYGGRDPVTMAVIFERHVSRKSEAGTWPPLRADMGMNFLIQGAPIEFGDIRHYTLLELLPAMTYTRRSSLTAGRLQISENAGDLSLTGRYGITPRLTLDGAVNPDFSQVEADAGQIDVNLRYNLFYPEKRPFFLEGGEIFNVGGPSSEDAFYAAVHTRTIGDPLAGVKLSGKLGPSDTVAALFAVDDLTSIAGSADRDQSAEVAVLRYKRTLTQDGYLGGFFTTRSYDGRSNRLAGADGFFRLDQSSSLGYHAFVSRTRPEAGAGSQDGHALGVDFARETRNLVVNVMAADVSTGFETDVGYLGRAGISRVGGAIGPRFYPQGGKYLRRINTSLATEHTRDAFDDIWESSTSATMTLQFVRSTTAVARYTLSSEVFGGKEFGTSGFTAQVASQATRQLNVTTSFALRNAIYYSASPFGGRSRRATFGATYLPTDNLHTELTFTYAGFAAASDGRRLYDYTIARSRTTYQVNRFLFFRSIFEYNSFRRQLTSDLLGSFTYVPGTVIHLGYGSLYDRMLPDDQINSRSRRFRETRRGLFFKASYLWRL